LKSAIYSITHVESGKIYIGSAVDYMKRWRDHRYSLNHAKHCNLKLQNAWNKHGEQAFEFAVVELVEDKADLLNREQFWMDFHQAYRKGYNMTPTAGSPLGRIQSPETREKLRQINSTPEARAEHSARHKGKIVSDATRAKQAQAKLGKKQTDEQRAKRSASMKAYWEKRHGN